MKNAEKNLDIDVSDFETALKFDEANKKKTDSAFGRKTLKSVNLNGLKGCKKMLI